VKWGGTYFKWGGRAPLPPPLATPLDDLLLRSKRMQRFYRALRTFYQRRELVMVRTDEQTLDLRRKPP